VKQTSLQHPQKVLLFLHLYKFPICPAQQLSMSQTVLNSDSDAEEKHGACHLFFGTAILKKIQCFKQLLMKISVSLVYFYIQNEKRIFNATILSIFIELGILMASDTPKYSVSPIFFKTCQTLEDECWTHQNLRLRRLSFLSVYGFSQCHCFSNPKVHIPRWYRLQISTMRRETKV
jgi:hypothetical protein